MFYFVKVAARPFRRCFQFFLFLGIRGELINCIYFVRIRCSAFFRFSNFVIGRAYFSRNVEPKFSPQIVRAINYSFTPSAYTRTSLHRAARNCGRNLVMVNLRASLLSS